ncbi:hypothetical protein [Paraburkholderia strydomiana]|jgi:hypothetical protein|uniref:hypothetical protein n=1 Tax=Paraburkholderia strydomiana TaxID=1245417 RepID=UPI0038BD91E2
MKPKLTHKLSEDPKKGISVSDTALNALRLLNGKVYSKNGASRPVCLHSAKCTVSTVGASRRHD